MTIQLTGRKLIAGLFAAAALGVGGERTYHTYRWAGDTNIRAIAGSESYRWLSQNITKDGKGKPINRAQIIDALVQNALKQYQLQQQTPQK